jgi:hypothetical protein
MEDRWHAYVEGERLYLHRSWTGRGIYEAGFVREAHGWRISDAVVEGDRRFYRRRDDAGETALLAALIDAVLLTEHAGPRYQILPDVPDQARELQGQEVPGRRKCSPSGGR